MHYVNVQTAQNVAIQYEVASIGDRIAAYFIDLLVFLAYILLFFLIIGSMPNFSGKDAVIVIAALPLFVYDLVLEYLSDGQSIGKKAMKIKVVMLDGSSPGIGAYLLRWLLRVVDLSLSGGALAVITIATGGKGQRIGDIAAGSCVVKLREQVKLDNIDVPNLQDNYTVEYPQAIRLSDADAAIVRESYNEAVKYRNYELMQALTEKICSVLEIEQPDRQEKFVKTVLNDYAYLTRREI